MTNPNKPTFENIIKMLVGAFAGAGGGGGVAGCRVFSSASRRSVSWACWAWILARRCIRRSSSAVIIAWIAWVISAWWAWAKLAIDSATMA